MGSTRKYYNVAGQKRTVEPDNIRYIAGLVNRSFTGLTPWRSRKGGGHILKLYTKADSPDGFRSEVEL